MTEESNKSVKSVKSKITIVIGILIIIALAGIIIYLLNRPEESRAYTGGGRATVVTPENLDKVRNAEPVPDGYYNASMNTEWTFKTSTTPSEDAYVKNGDMNTRTVYMDVILADTEDVVYSSPYIPVGSELKNFALDKELPAGDYDAIAKYYLVDDNKNVISDVSLTVKLHILN